MQPSYNPIFCFIKRMCNFGMCVFKTSVETNKGFLSRHCSNKYLYQFAKAVVIKYHKPGGLNNSNFLFHSSGGQKSTIKVLTEWFLLRLREGICSMPRAQLLGVYWQLLAFLGLEKHHLHLALSSSSHGEIPVCMSVQISPFYEDVSHIGSGFTLKTSFYFDYLSEDPLSTPHPERYISKVTYLSGWWRRGGTIEPISYPLKE